MSHISTFSGQSSGALTATVSCVIPASATYCVMFASMRVGGGGATTLSSATLAGDL